MTKQTWTPAIEADLRVLWMDTSLLVAQIAERLAKKYNAPINKNSALGKAFRMKLPQRLPAQRAQAVFLVEKKVADRSVRAELLGRQDVGEDPVSLADVRHDQCRWPCGDPHSTGFHLCGGKIYSASPYCNTHYKIAYRPDAPSLDVRRLWDIDVPKGADA